MGDILSLVSINGTSLNNTSGGAAAPYYTAYPQSGSTTASLELSGVYTMTVNVAGGTEHVAVWIDYNQDGTLDASELAVYQVQLQALAQFLLLFLQQLFWVLQE